MDCHSNLAASTEKTELYSGQVEKKLTAIEFSINLKTAIKSRKYLKHKLAK